MNTNSSTDSHHPVAETAAWNSAHAANEVYDEIQDLKRNLGNLETIQSQLGEIASKDLTNAGESITQEIGRKRLHLNSLIDIASVVYGQQSDSSEVNVIPPEDSLLSDIDTPTNSDGDEHDTREKRAFEFVTFTDILTESRETIELGEKSASYKIAELIDRREGGETLSEEESDLLDADSFLDAKITGTFLLGNIVTPAEFQAFANRIKKTLDTLSARDGDATLSNLEGDLLDCLDDITQSNLGIKDRERKDANNRYGMQLATIKVKAAEARANILSAIDNTHEAHYHTKNTFQELSEGVGARDAESDYAPIIDFMTARFTLDIIGQRKQDAETYNLEAFEHNYAILSQYLGDIQALSDFMKDNDILNSLYMLEGNAKKDGLLYQQGRPDSADKRSTFPIWQSLNGLVHAVKERHDNPERKNAGNMTGYKERPYRAVRLTRRLGYTIDAALAARRNELSVASETIDTEDF